MATSVFTRTGGSVKNKRLQLIDYNKMFLEASDPRIINDLYFDDPTLSIVDLILQRSEGSVDFAPSCECGAFKGSVYEGHTCPFCLTVVRNEFTKNFKANNWVGIPEGMPKVLHPRLYILLAGMAGRFRINKKNSKIAGKRQKLPIIDFILDPNEELPDDIAIGVHGQGYTYFDEHMEEILHFLLLEHPKFSKLPEARAIWAVYEKERDRNNVLIDKLPLLNAAFHPLHVRGRSRTMDKTADIVIPVVVDMIHTSFANKRLVTDRKFADREIWEVYSKYITYLKKIMEIKIGDKQALIRRHNVAARLHFTGRAVISPVLERHDGDEVYLPWNIGMMVEQCEIINLLCNRHGYTVTEAVDYFYRHVNVYSPLLDSIFETLIRECPRKGLPILLNRNPTLIRESIRLVYCTRVKTDPNDKTLNLSPRICKGFNAEQLSAA